MGRKKASPIKAQEGTSPFDMVRSLFAVKDVAGMYSSEMIRQSFFIINRTLAIKYPLQANAFNRLKINPTGALVSWNLFLYNGKGPGSWVYTKGGGKSAKERVTETGISASIVKEYAHAYSLKVADVEAALKIFPEDAAVALNEFADSVMDNKKKPDK